MSSKVNIYQIKITLKGCKPPIWRRIQLASTTDLSMLHQIFQIVMGWDNYHMHQFHIKGMYYGDVSVDDEVLDEEKIKLCQVVTSVKEKFSYEYDFGDGWDHVIMLEKILPAEEGIQYPICITGKGACPPEDCGGIYGYADLLDIIADSKHPEYAEMIERLGTTFSPEAFDANKINEQLIAIT